MAKIDNVKRIIKEQFDPEYHNLITKLGYVLNTFMEQATDEINGGLNFDNLNRDIVKVRFAVDANGEPLRSNKIRVNNVRNIEGTNVIRARNLDDTGTYVITQPHISFVSTGNLITVQNITGLQVGEEYELTIEIIGN